VCPPEYAYTLSSQTAGSSRYRELPYLYSPNPGVIILPARIKAPQDEPMQNGGAIVLAKKTRVRQHFDLPT